MKFSCLFKNENNFQAQAFHFLVDNQNSSSLIITCIYPNNQNDESLSNMRKNVHRLLDLTLEKPLLRKIDAFQFAQSLDSQDSASQFSKYLQNPHLSAKPSNGKSILTGLFL